MSLSVLNNISALYAQNYLNQTQASLQTVLQQLSSGSRINSGADDAAGLAVVNGLQGNEAALTQSAQNATNGTGLLQTADGALAQVTSLLTRAVTLATEAANSTLNPTQVSSANQEYQTILAEIGDIGASTNFSGNQVFSTNTTNLFVSDGSATGANTYNDTVGVLTTGSVGQSPSTATVSTSAVTVAAAGSTAAANVQGTGTITLTTAGDTITGSLAISLANGTSTNFTVSGVTEAQFVSAFNANTAFTSQGLSATATSTTVITIKGPASGQGGNVTFGANSLVESTAAATPAVATGTTAVDGRSLESITLSTPTNTFAGSINIGVGTGTQTSFTVNTGTTGTALANQINSNATYQANNIKASFDSTTGVLSIYGPAGVGNTLNLTSSALTQTTTLSPGAGVNFTDASINTLTAGTAQAVLVGLSTAIQDVAYQRGILGANINQLNAAANVADTQEVNLTSASNAIQATNYGQATSDLAKYEVLSQTGISALAQANTVQQEILKLLQ